MDANYLTVEFSIRLPHRKVYELIDLERRRRWWWWWWWQKSRA